jgi:hypothetical protein
VARKPVGGDLEPCFGLANPMGAANLHSRGLDLQGQEAIKTGEAEH